MLSTTKILAALLSISLAACTAVSPPPVSSTPAVTKPEVLHIKISDAHRLGKKSATVGIIDFSDYQCPYCRNFNDQVLPRLKTKYIDTGLVVLMHKDLPLRSIHPQALPAALAARCAGEQDNFWQMHAALYANQSRLGPDLYLELARGLGIKTEEFSACLNAPAQKQIIMLNIAEARAANITGTPSFIIGKIAGDTLSVVRTTNGLPSFEAFVQEIERLLRPTESETAPPQNH